MKKIFYLFLILAVVVIGCQRGVNNEASNADYESVEQDVNSLESVNNSFSDQEINDLDKDLDLGDDF